MKKLKSQGKAVGLTAIEMRKSFKTYVWIFVLEFGHRKYLEDNIWKQHFKLSGVPVLYLQISDKKNLVIKNDQFKFSNTFWVGALQNWLLADPSLKKVLNSNNVESHMHFYYITVHMYFHTANLRTF